MSDKSSIELEGDYYVVNFFQLSDFVVQTYQDLLTSAELDWYNSLRAVPIDAQRLYIRLLTRRGSIFRLSRLRYTEINSTSCACKELERHFLAHCDAPQPMSVLLENFTKPEILKILNLRISRAMSRADLVQYVSGVDTHVQEYYRQCLQRADRWVAIRGYVHWQLFQLCFFGNLYQDSSTLTLDQMGTVKYADYTIDQASRAFTTRRQIEAHWRYFECETLYECCKKSDKDALVSLAGALPDKIAGDAALRRRLDRIRNRIARQLERLGCFDIAHQLYQQSEHPPARERRARMMMEQQAWADASGLIRQMSDAPRSEAERLTATRLLAQCCKARGLAHTRVPVFKPLVSRLVLQNTGGRVEEIARRYYTRHGRCFYVENALVTGALGLFIWDIIFYPLPGVFFNRYQIAPADFYEPEFQARRQGLIEQRFSELSDKQRFYARLRSNFETYYGNVNPLVNWHRLSPDLLSLAAERIGSSQWLALFSRVLLDPREHRSGLPDLVLFAHDGGYEFIEIKGPGDSLQSNQRQWMQYFSENDISYRLVNIGFRIGLRNETSTGEQPCSENFNTVGKNAASNPDIGLSCQAGE